MLMVRPDADHPPPTAPTTIQAFGPTAIGLSWPPMANSNFARYDAADATQPVTDRVANWRTITPCSN
jgi:hypothetical protein